MSVAPKIRVVTIRAYHQKTYETVHWTTFITHVWLIFIFLLIIFSFWPLTLHSTHVRQPSALLAPNPPFLNATIYHCPRYLLHRVNKDALILGYVIIWLVNHCYQSLAWLLGEDQFTARRDFSTSPRTGHKYLTLKKSDSVSLLLLPPMPIKLPLPFPKLTTHRNIRLSSVLHLPRAASGGARRRKQTVRYGDCIELVFGLLRMPKSCRGSSQAIFQVVRSRNFI